VQFGLDRFVKSRFQSRRECAKKTRRIRGLPQSVLMEREVAVNEFGAEFIFKGGDLFCSQQVDQFPRSFATAEKLPFSIARTNICIASNLSTAASTFLYGMDSKRGLCVMHSYLE